MTITIVHFSLDNSKSVCGLGQKFSDDVSSVTCKRCLQTTSERQLPTERKCSKCKTVKPASEFWIDRQHLGHLVGHCKDCMRREYRESRYLKLKNDPKYRESHRRNQRLYAARHPGVVKAHSKAYRNRDVIMKSACERCGSIDNLHMHHPDYTKPLLVVTLCNPCHEVAHHSEDTK